MKRILTALVALLLLAACSAPDAKPADARPERTETEPTAQAEQSTPKRTEANPEQPVPTAPDESGEPQTPAAEAKPSTATKAPESEDTVVIAPSSAEPLPTFEPAPNGILGTKYSEKFSDTPILGERSYKSKSISVEIKTYTVKDTYAKIASYHVADIYVKDVTSIRAAAAEGDFNTRYARTVREIADNVGALLAIDGDTYFRVKQSFVIRNGELYRDTLIEDTDLCVLYRDGRMETKKWGTFTMQEIIDSDPWQVWGFGPALLDENGHAIADIRAESIGGHNPRAAIGYYEPGHYCFVIVDGRRSGWSEGMRLPALSQLMEDLGCTVAYNLDGGSSAQMYWNGDIISKVSDDGRRVSDIIYLLPEE